ncbi:Clan S-, family S54, Rhomboid-like serine peptidase [Histomonas meleagridis]|uniref:Clan S, family S54, Rhomboid-like serine peptidase n=1 Tax=Histomonas meleagridis TaxID=135588 RepID=UPI0035598250|nr:Clan S-, family S54, Rhomboid-like serine peptidase [Histomonas meleagridis]KAH0804447.1 Clan S, family S54, Rhomboid-like serine peptidase [Histomonas meleagridis]
MEEQADNGNWWDGNVSLAHNGNAVQYDNGDQPNRNRAHTIRNQSHGSGNNPSRSRGNTALQHGNNRQQNRSRSTTARNRSHTVRNPSPAALIRVEAPTPLIWTIGSTLIMLLLLICEIIQCGGFNNIKKNPLLGPDDSTMIQMGAKYGPLIMDGEIWRLITAIFVQNGIIYFVVTVVLVFFTRKIERDTGFWRAFVLFIISGTYGYIASCLFVSTSVSCGATGVMFGYLGLLLGDLIASWHTLKKPVFRLVAMIITILILLLIGLTPYVDNFVHIGGLIMGFLFALMMLPNLNFGKCERCCHGIVAFLAFPVMATLYMISLVVFFREVVNDNWCKWCHYLNCVNISGWCPPVE